jgi:hypothetical protein
LRARQFESDRLALIAVDPRPVSRGDDGWTVTLRLTNVGDADARRVRVRLVTATGEPIGDEAPLGQPLLAHKEGEDVSIRVRDPMHRPRTVFALREYRDKQGSKSDLSEQPIELF